MSPQMWNYVIHIVRRLSKVNAKITVCDLPPLSGSSFYFNWMSLFRKMITPAIRRYLKVGSVFQENNVTVQSRSRYSMKAEQESLYLDVLRMENPFDLEYWDAYNGVMGKSVFSNLVTSLEMSMFTNSKKWKRKCRNQIKDFLHTVQIIENLLIHGNEIVCLFVPNSRFPTQAAAGLVASQRDVLEISYESGGNSEELVHVDEWPPINRIRQQQDFESKINELSRSQSVNDTKTGKNKDKVLEIIDPTKKKYNFSNNLSGNRLAVYFYGSDDEYVGLGDSWPVHRWRNQFEALEEVIPYLISNRFDVVLRHHPNSMNKPWREMRRIHELGRFDNTWIIPSYERVQSKDLIDLADVVITWGSTVGIESVLAGKPLWLLSHTYYDRAIDVRKWPVNSHPNPSELIYHPERNSADLFSSYLKSFGEELEISLEERKRCKAATRTLALFNQFIIICGIPVAVSQNPQLFFKITEILFGGKIATRLMHRLTYNGETLKTSNYP